MSKYSSEKICVNRCIESEYFKGVDTSKIEEILHYPYIDNDFENIDLLNKNVLVAKIKEGSFPDMYSLVLLDKSRVAIFLDCCTIKELGQIVIKHLKEDRNSIPGGDVMGWLILKERSVLVKRNEKFSGLLKTDCFISRMMKEFFTELEFDANDDTPKYLYLSRVQDKDSGKWKYVLTFEKTAPIGQIVGYYER